MNTSHPSETIHWTLDPGNPVIRPGQIHGELDARRCGAAHVLRLGDTYRMYYWADDREGRKHICCAAGDVDHPNIWRPLGEPLSAQAETEYNRNGPSFPFVLGGEGEPWRMYFCAWGSGADGKKLPNTTGLAVSEDEGLTWRYAAAEPILPLDRPWDRQGTGSCCVLRVGGELRMYYTAIGSYFSPPPGVRTGHGDVVPRIGVAYAVSTDGVHWDKPLDDLMISPRGLDGDPYEYICSKPFIVREPDGYRMWVSTFGPAYRIRSLTSPDGLAWTWEASGPDGEFGVGKAGEFDDHQRSYACVVRHGEQYRCWYTGNGFGTTGMGYAIAARIREE